MPVCNAYVERFHGLCDQFFWQRHHFTDLAAIKAPYANWLTSFRQNYRPDSGNGQTPRQLRQTLPDQRVGTLPEGLNWTPARSLPWVAGRIHCLRRTDSQGHLDVLGHPFTLDARYRLSYIRATVAVAHQQTAFYFQPTADDPPALIDTQPFSLPHDIVPWEPSLYLKYLT